MVNVDDLSKLKDETLKMRKGEIPKAQKIIALQMAEFKQWFEMRKHVPMLKHLKIKLKELYEHPLNGHRILNACPKTIDSQIQRVLNDTAGKIKIKNQRGCQYISAINDFIRLD